MSNKHHLLNIHHGIKRLIFFTKNPNIIIIAFLKKQFLT